MHKNVNIFVISVLIDLLEKHACLWQNMCPYVSLCVVIALVDFVSVCLVIMGVSYNVIMLYKTVFVV